MLFLDIVDALPKRVDTISSFSDSKTSSLFDFKRAFLLDSKNKKYNDDFCSHKETICNTQRKENDNPLEMLKDFQRRHKNQKVQTETQTKGNKLISERKKEIVSMLSKDEINYNKKYPSRTLSLLSNENGKSLVLTSLELMKTKLATKQTKKMKSIL